MNSPKYPIVAIDGQWIYEFYSEGPVGRIKKVVAYQRIEKDFFNLAFGDWNEQLKKIDDSSRSNNGDRDKVLMTVAYTALDFFNHHPNTQILIEGSTASRTRLYQIAIAYNLLEINANFKVNGFIGEGWELFQRGRNYDGFLIQRK
jgi:hypothetical protein